MRFVGMGSLALLVLLAAQAAGAPASADAILAGAPERIREHRMGALEVTVVDAAGKPVSGAMVHVEQTRHEFLFGSNIFSFDRFPAADQNELYRTRFDSIFNFATLPFYWGSFEREQGEPDYSRNERIARWCAEQGITPKGHPLVWNHPAGSPRWLPADPAEVRRLSDARVAACVSRFQGKIDVFDVVNEATHPLRPKMENPMSDLIREIGIEDYTRTPFEIARRRNPAATLLINDYRTDPAYEKVIRSLQVKGKPLYDVIGIQSHMHGGAWTPEKTWEICERFGGFGVPVHFTEATIVSGPKTGDQWGATTPAMEETQARQIVDFYTVLFSHPSVEAITWWDFSDHGAWQGAPAGLLRRDLSPKPAFTALHKLIKGRWWTRSDARTDARGRLTARAFFGNYRVTCTLPDGREAAAEVVLTRASARAACTLKLER